jgi:hypothetical protein
LKSKNSSEPLKERFQFLAKYEAGEANIFPSTRQNN